MAIVFTTALPQDQVLNAYNNSVIEFYSDVDQENVKATIAIDALTFEATPSPDDKYYFNFISIIKTLINANYFQDTIEPENENSIVYADDSLYKEIEATITVEFDDGTTDQTTINLSFIKAVDQEENYKRNLTNAQNSTIALLLPFIPESNQDYHATYFEGYPFDVALYSDADRTVTLKNTTTGLTSDVEVSKGVNRIFLSDGDNNFSVDEIIPLQVGINVISLSVDDTPLINLHLTKADSICGTYFKWFNDQGGWSYFLFHKYDRTLTTKETESFTKDFQNLSNADDRFYDMGVESEYENKFFAMGITPVQMQLIEALKGSSKVYRYLNKRYQTGKRIDWITDKIKPGKLRTFNRIRNTYDVQIETENTKQNKVAY